MTILEVEKLKVSYSNHVAIENINFKIEDGEYVCLVGENGSGKSTLVKTIVGLLKPEDGQVNLNISWSPIDYDSISYIISAAANTNKITISVSSHTYNLLS